MRHYAQPGPWLTSVARLIAGAPDHGPKRAPSPLKSAQAASVEKVVDSHPVHARKVLQLDGLDAPLTRLALRDK